MGHEAEARNAAINRLRNFPMNSEIAILVKSLFWTVANKRPGGGDLMKKSTAEWCEAIDALPDTSLLEKLNIIELEVSIDVIHVTLKSLGWPLDRKEAEGAKAAFDHAREKMGMK